MGSYCLLDAEFLFCKMRFILEQDSSAICTKTINVLNANDLYAIVCFISVLRVFKGSH